MPGCYGKIPALGDFLTRNLPEEFIRPWDAWLRDVMMTAAQNGGDTWTDLYLTGPVWRFAVTPRLLGPRGWAGIMMSSVDKVGRCFPLTIAAPVPEGVPPSQVATLWRAEFERAEALALAVIDRSLEPEAFVDQLRQLPDMAAPADAPREAGRWTDGGRAGAMLEGAPTLIDDPEAVMTTLTRSLLTTAGGGVSLWWHVGWGDLAPASALYAGLPPARACCAMLDGRWTDWGWSR